MSSELYLTQNAQDALEEMEMDPRFEQLEEAVDLIQSEIKARIPTFSLYIKRYINSRLGLSWDDERPQDFYLQLIEEAFQSSGTPVSFDVNCTTKPKAAIRNWLTHRTVSRKTILLLGFGLQMSPEDVDTLLTKGICEQAINPKDPFEVNCWYCYRHSKDFDFFNALMDRYQQLTSVASQGDDFTLDATANIRNSMYGIEDVNALFDYLATLKTSTNIPRISRTATKYFVQLCDQIKEYIAKDDGSDSKEISDQQVQDLLYAGIGKSDAYNLLPEKQSDLYEAFSIKRLNRQRIGKLYRGEESVTRYDLITLNFVLFSLREDLGRLRRYNRFIESTNLMLKACSLQDLIIQNPYEYFVLACILTQIPLETYWEVWENSFFADEEWKSQN